MLCSVLWSPGERYRLEEPKNLKEGEDKSPLQLGSVAKIFLALEEIPTQIRRQNPPKMTSWLGFLALSSFTSKMLNQRHQQIHGPPTLFQRVGRPRVTLTRHRPPVSLPQLPQHHTAALLSTPPLSRGGLRLLLTRCPSNVTDLKGYYEKALRQRHRWCLSRCLSPEQLPTTS